MLNGMLWIARSGAQWSALPESYGLEQSVYTRLAKWQDDSTLERVFHALSEDADTENPSMVWADFSHRFPLSFEKRNL